MNLQARPELSVAPRLPITGLRATPVNLPLDKPMWWTGGHQPGTSKTIVEVETDGG